MIFVLLVALYAFATRRVAFAPGFTITGPRARIFGFLILVLIFPVRWLFALGMNAIVPAAWMSDRLHFAIVNVVFLVGYVAILALVCRDPRDEPVP